MKSIQEFEDDKAIRKRLEEENKHLKAEIHRIYKDTLKRYDAISELTLDKIKNFNQLN